MTQQIDRREQVYSAAGTLFSRNGYHATSMRDIARELNLQGGSLYAHIESKEDVLWELVQRAAREFLGAARPLAQTSAPASERLRGLIHQHVRVLTRHRDDATVFLHEWRFLAPERRQAVQRQRDEYEALFRRVIEDGIKSGEFRSVDPGLTALAVLSVGNWMYQWYKPDGSLTPEQIASSFSELLLNGVMKGGVDCD